MENQEICAEVILGVDNHLDIHVGAVIDATGRVLGTLSVGTHNEAASSPQGPEIENALSNHC